MQISAQLQLRYLDFSIFTGGCFHGQVHPIVSTLVIGKMLALWDVCVLARRNCWGKIIIYTKDNKSNLCLPPEDGRVMWEIPMSASLQENQSLLLATPTFPVHMLKMRVENRWVALKCDLIRIWSRRLDKCRLSGGMVGSSHEN